MDQMYQSHGSFGSGKLFSKKWEPAYLWEDEFLSGVDLASRRRHMKMRRCFLGGLQRAMEKPPIQTHWIKIIEQTPDRQAELNDHVSSIGCFLPEYGEIKQVQFPLHIKHINWNNALKPNQVHPLGFHQLVCAGRFFALGLLMILGGLCLYHGWLQGKGFVPEVFLPEIGRNYH